MKDAKDPLFELIKILTPAEQKRVKEQLTGAGHKKGETVLLTIFSVLCRAKQYDKKNLLTVLNKKRGSSGKGKLANTLSRHKNDLKQIILQQLAYSAPQHVQDRHRKLETIATLFRRGLADETLHQISLFKKDVIKEEKFSYAISANYIGVMALDGSSNQDVAKASNDMAQESVELAYKEYTSAVVYHFYLKGYALLTKGTLINTQEDLQMLKELEADKANSFNIQELSFIGKRFFLIAKMALARLNAEYAQALFYALENWNLHFQKYGEKGAIAGGQNYLLAAIEVLFSAMMNGRADIMQQYLPVAQSLKKQIGPNNRVTEVLLWHFEFNAAAMSKKNSDWTHDLKTLEERYVEASKYIKPDIRRMLEIDLIMGNFKQQNFGETILVARDFCKEDKLNEVGINLRNLMLLISTIAYYELFVIPSTKAITYKEFDEAVSYFSRKLDKTSNNCDKRIERAFIAFFKKAIKCEDRSNSHIPHLEHLRNTLKGYEQENLLYLKQLNNYFDTTTWVNQKLQKLKQLSLEH